jgi:hypothetical protein
MERYKFAVMVTYTNHSLKVIEIEADDLAAGRQILERAATRFDRNWEVDHWHLFVADTDYGRPDDWPWGLLTTGELAELFHESHALCDEMRDPTRAPIYRIDWIDRLAPEQ